MVDKRAKEFQSVFYSLSAQSDDLLNIAISTSMMYVIRPQCSIYIKTDLIMISYDKIDKHSIFGIKIIVRLKLEQLLVKRRQF